MTESRRQAAGPSGVVLAGEGGRLGFLLLAPLVQPL
jgi:hypothetical protein